MSFYENLSRVYEYVFPVQKPALDLLHQLAGFKTARILDIACGTGGHAGSLAASGHNVYACDLDRAMAARAGARPGVKAFAADMRTLASTPELADISGSFDLIYCIGNSLVHLSDENEIAEALAEMSYLLRPGGKLLIQIINYHRIMLGHLPGLPTIKNVDAGIEFERHYNYPQADDGIIFRTILRTGIGSADYQESEGQVRLLPLQPDRLLEILTTVGLSDIRVFGSFSGDAFEPESSVPFIAIAAKTDNKQQNN